MENLKSEIKRKIYNFTIKLVTFIDSLNKNSSTQIIGNQLVRSGTSIGANYIEGQSASSKKDFTNFIHHALKSANESKFWLAILRDTNKANKDNINKLLNDLKEIANILGASLLTLKGKRK